MTDYSALASYWQTLPAAKDIGSIKANLASVNARTIAGSLVDVPIGKVAGYLMRNGKLLALDAYAQSPPQGANPVAVGGAKMLAAICANQSVLTVFEMSDPVVAGEIEAMLSAMVSDGNAGLTSADQVAILALAASAPLVWHNASASEGGAGLPGVAVNGWDLFNAGLVSQADADAVEAA